MLYGVLHIETQYTVTLGHVLKELIDCLNSQYVDKR